MVLHVHHLNEGDGPPVVCLHGVMGHGGRFRDLARRLDGRRVVAFDLRGHGASSWVPPWNVETFRDDVVHTLDHLAIDRCDLVGFSFGGRLGLELAASRPDLVNRLALLDPAIQLDPEVALQQSDLMRTDVSFAHAAEAVDARMATLAFADRSLVESDVAEALVAGDDERLRYRVSRSAVVAAYGEMSRPPALPNGSPTLLVRADAGIVSDDAHALLGRSLGPLLTVVRVRGGHSVMWDAAEETATAVVAHLGN